MFFFSSRDIYVWIFEKGAKELNSPLERAFFFSLVSISKGDDIKIKTKVSPFFSFSTHLSSFHCGPFSIFLLLHGLKGGVKEW